MRSAIAVTLFLVLITKSSAVPNAQSAFREQLLGPVGPSNDKVIRATGPGGCHIAWRERRGAVTVIVHDGRASKPYDVATPPILSRDGTRCMFRASEHNQACIVVDFQEGPKHDNITDQGLGFSPDGRRYAYVGQTPSSKEFVVVDGQAGPEYDAVFDVQFAPQGGRVAYVAVTRGGDWRVVCDGKPGPPHREVVLHSLTFSPDGQRLAYAIRRDGKLNVVVDGREDARGPYDGIVPDALTFSPDSRRFAFAGIRARRCIVVVDGQEQSHDGEAKLPIRFSPDSRHLYYPVEREGKWRMVTDGVDGPPHELIRAFDYSPDGQRSYCAVREGQQVRVWADGKAHVPFDDLSRDPPIFSADSKHLGYVAFKEGKQLVVIDGKPGPPYELVIAPTAIFSPDGSRTAYAAKSNQKFMVVTDGQPGPLYDRLGERTLCFSPNGKRVGYGAQRNGRWYYVIDGREGPAHDGIGDAAFSSDGKHVAYLAAKGKNRVIVADGKESAEYQSIPCSLVFRSDGQLEFLGIRDDKLYRVTAQVDGD